MSSTMNRRGPVVLIGLAVVLALAALLTGGFGSGGKASADGTPIDNGPALTKLLTVSTSSVDCKSVVSETGGKVDGNIVGYVIGVLKSVPPRKWSDALSTPLAGSTPAEKRRALYAAVCEDPELGSSIANMLAHLTVDGVNVGSLNSWLSPFAGDASQINDIAASYIPLMDVKKPTSAQVKVAASKNVEWQEVASKVDTLIGRFSLGDVRSLASVTNYHLTAGGLSVGGLSEVGINPHQENLPALTMSVTLKGGCAPLKVIGFNVGDKRPEVFKTPTCVKPHKPSKPGHHPTPTPCKHNCGPTHNPTPSCTPSKVHEQCGKDANFAPPVTKATPVRTPPPGGYCPRPVTKTSACSPTPYTPPPTANPSPGKGDSGPGATNTTPPPHTSSPGPAPSNTSAPHATATPSPAP
ncbi:MAG: hypothetical protein JWO41_351 [Candidatus Saccharibacteria bacterium]|nr:hypothetical protein [Candidatus Saccharibacteria bacterium]